ncbi:hypothetical protein SK128_013025, partial [Halocaridina rubra]
SPVFSHTVLPLRKIHTCRKKSEVNRQSKIINLSTFPLPSHHFLYFHSPTVVIYPPTFACFT